MNDDTRPGSAHPGKPPEGVLPNDPADAGAPGDSGGPGGPGGPGDPGGPGGSGTAGEPGGIGEAEPTVRLPAAVDLDKPAPAGGGSGARPPGGPGHGGDPGPSGDGGSGEPSGALRYAPAADEPGAVRAKRFWAGRRVPSALTAAVVLALSGLFLYDVASVRSGRKAMRWRKKLADELATRHLDDVWVILGAAVCAALGLWLLVLALTPGERSVLPMARRGAAGVRAGLDRHAAALTLRDRAMEVAGVRWARVTVGRRRIKARAATHFRELTDVRRDLTTALEDAVGQLGLARSPSLHVHVRPAEKKA